MLPVRRKKVNLPPVVRALSPQKSKRPGGKNRNSPAPSGELTPIAAFFAAHLPQFKYDPTVSASWEFYRLCDVRGWGKETPEKKRAHQAFKDALVQEFNHIYGTDMNSLANWQNLCCVVRIEPAPDDLHACREAVRKTFVNLVDLVDTRKTGIEVELFETERRLSEYTISTGKIFPRENAYAGGLLRYLLRHIFHPRDDPPSQAGSSSKGERSRKGGQHRAGAR